jgi:hypothetical protein
MSALSLLDSERSSDLIGDPFSDPLTELRTEPLTELVTEPSIDYLTDVFLDINSFLISISDWAFSMSASSVLLQTKVLMPRLFSMARTYPNMLSLPQKPEAGTLSSE